MKTFPSHASPHLAFLARLRQEGRWLLAIGAGVLALGVIACIMTGMDVSDPLAWTMVFGIFGVGLACSFRGFCYLHAGRAGSAEQMLAGAVALACIALPAALIALNL